MTVPFLIVLSAVTVWKILRLARDPGNDPLRAVALCLVCATLSRLLAMADGPRGFHAVAGHGAAKLTQNVLLLAACYFLMCFYLYSAADQQTGRVRARWEGLGLLLVIGAVAGTALTIHHTALAGSFSTADMTRPQVAGFYLLSGLYMLYSLASAFWWTRRYAHMSKRPLSTGLWCIAAGLAGMSVACAMRAVFVLIRSDGSSVSAGLARATSLTLVLSVSTFVIGLSYPGVRTRVSAVRVWRHHRNLHRRLHPLWQLLTDAFPQTVLHAPTSPSWYGRWQARSIHHRYHRRVIECRDGLVQVRPYLDLAETEHGESVSGDSPPMRVALRLQRAQGASLGGATRGRDGSLLTPTRRGHRDADVQQLLALSDALRFTA
ncbi:hypothetical protein SMCF_8270 [Streptomyces coelicoflavus ZG0656]|nr:hypothetical protein SMCF_8270 [Streptomyces coelicoflavus ZG0656]MZE43548.1 hypothetical protein [Streptomyces sp. SID5477]